jgi:ribonucleoside-diphosphate reductase alpha chain
MGLPYDSDGARNLAAGLTSLMTGYSYYTSSLMAEKVGAFEAYELNKDYMMTVIRNHARAASYDKSDVMFENLAYKPVTVNHTVLKRIGMNNIAQALRSVWKNTIISGSLNGFRNAQVSVLAPTGTIAFAMDCATTSSEPFFSHVTYKKLVGGSYMEIVNPAIPAALTKLGYSENEVEQIVKFVMRKNDAGYIADGKIEDAPYLKPEHYDVFDTASKCGTGVRYISPEGHVRMMGALTPHVTGAISKTVNLPREATPDEIKEIYMLSWKLGVKAIALYRDGCKACQPLSSGIMGEATERKFEDYTHAELIEYIKTEKIIYQPKRVKPKGIRTARVHEVQINGLRLYVTASFYEDGKLGEIYVSSGRQGSLTKGLLESISQTISEMLQYGVPPQDIARMYRGQKYEPSGFVNHHPYIKYVDSISDLISKIIDIELGNFDYVQVKPEGYISKTFPTAATADAPVVNYTEKDVLHGEICPTCGSPRMVRNGTCKVCTECGSTTGCS